MMTQPIVTDRLYLRRFAVSDAEACYCNWMSDPEVTHFLTWGVHPDVEHTRKVLTEWVGEYSRGSLDWCITLRGEYVPIGSVTAVRQHPESGYCELGYCLAQGRCGVYGNRVLHWLSCLVDCRCHNLGSLFRR